MYKYIVLCYNIYFIIDVHVNNYWSIDVSNKLINKNLFIDRISELEKICIGLKNGTDFVLIAPRRYGKTTLVNQAFSSISGNRDYLLLTIDIMRYSGSVRNLAMNITDKALGLLGLSGRLHSMISKVELSL